MPYQPTTNFNDSNGVDLGKKLVTNDYLLTVYGSILDSIGGSSLTVSPSLWSWGQGAFGQLGDYAGTISDKYTPVTTILGGINWKSVSCGSKHTAAIKTDGTLWIWGGNSYGQLGVNSTTDIYTPVTTLLGGTNWKSISCGYYNTSAIKTDGTLWTWGNNYYGQLGVNNTVTRSTPVTTLLGGTNWGLISCGDYNNISIKTDGSLWSWGRNDYGQL